MQILPSVNFQIKGSKNVIHIKQQTKWNSKTQAEIYT